MLCFLGALHLATFLFVCYYYMGSFLLCEATNSIPYVIHIMTKQTAATQQITKMCIISGKEHE